MIEKLIQGVEFGGNQEVNKPEIMETLESNFKVARRVYQQLHYDIAELIYEYIQSIDLYE